MHRTAQPNTRMTIGLGNVRFTSQRLARSQPAPTVPGFDEMAGPLDERPVAHPGGARGLARATTETEVQVPDAHGVQGDRPLVDRAHELNPPPGRVHLGSQLQERGTGRDAEAAVDTVPGVFKISGLEIHCLNQRYRSVDAVDEPSRRQDVPGSRVCLMRFIKGSASMPPPQRSSAGLMSGAACSTTRVPPSRAASPRKRSTTARADAAKPTRRGA